MNHNKALVIVDAQRGFMPAEEGERLQTDGFGELTVPNGHHIVPYLNRLTRVFRDHDMRIATTQDMHPLRTAHISETPNFIDTWPAHCIAGTPGAELHPNLEARHGRVKHFIKGDVAARTPAEDDSYTGALAHRFDPRRGEELLPDYLRRKAIEKVYIGGLALGDGKDHPLCVDSTALDLQKLGFNVTVVTDAVEAVVPSNREICFKNLGAAGIRLMSTADTVADIFNTPEVIR